MEINFQDFLGWSTDKEILKVIGKENIYFSNKVFKFNKLKMKQERNLLLTDRGIYNFHNKKIRRQMKYEDVLGITFSNQSNEFVIHAGKGYDFHFLSPDKTIIIYIIARCYEKVLNKPIILCEVKDKALKQYVTSKKEKRKDNTISRLNEKNIIDTQTYIIDNDPVDINKRSFTEVGGKLNTNITVFQENEKFLSSEIIFSNDDKIQSIGFEDFDFCKIIGRGITGKVFLCRNTFDNEYYAIKSIDKNFFDISKSPLKKIKKISKNLSFPFLNNVKYCFDTDNRLYFAFPYIQGEELFFYIKTNKIYDENRIKFYAAIIGLTLDFIHKNGIEYKLFNSRNILIDKDGYLKMIPFHIGKMFKIINNNNISEKVEKIKEDYLNEYSPPEIFEEGNTKNEKASDWWNLGIIIFEMIYTIPPFYSDNKNEMKKMIIHNELKFPINPKISDNLKDLINKLLNKKYEERLGYQNGFEEIKNHEFFKNFKFYELLDKKLEPPYKPIIRDILQNNKKIEEKFTYEDLRKSGILYSY